MPTAANPILDAVAERLIPLFQADGLPEPQARAAALEAIAACQPQSPADYASIGRILAFSLAAIAALGRAAETDLPPNLQLRFLGKANTLSRSAAQAERTMIQRRQLATQPPKATPRPAAQQQPAPSAADPTALAQIESAMAEFLTLLPQHNAHPVPPFAARPNTAPPPSFRQTLRRSALHTTA